MTNPLHLDMFQVIRYLEPSWAVLGDLGPSWDDLGPSWGRLGASCGVLGALLGRLGPSCGDLGAVLGRSCRQFDPSETSRGKSMQALTTR